MTLPTWIKEKSHNWKARLGGVYWLHSRKVVKQVAPLLSQHVRPVLIDIKSDAVGFGYRFDLNTWDKGTDEHGYFLWDGSDDHTPATTEDVFQILGASNAEFILNIPTPLNRVVAPVRGKNGDGYLWQTPEFYAAMCQYFFGAAGPESQWKNLAITADFFATPTSFNWADLRARRGRVDPYPIVAIIIGEEPYNLEGQVDGKSYGPQAEKFRLAIRERGIKTPLGLHIRDMGIVNDPNGGWFNPMMTAVNARDFSFIDVEHYYQFSTATDDFKRAYPLSINPKGFQGWWLPKDQWKADYSKFLWIIEDIRKAIQDSKIAGLGDASRWQLGFSEHGIQVATQFVYNDMGAALHWANWLAEMMRLNITWDSAWTFLAEGFSTAAVQVVKGQVTRTPMFFVYQMAQEFYGLDYLESEFVSEMGSTTSQEKAVEYPMRIVRVFRNSADGKVHLFVVNQNTKRVDVPGFGGWKIESWKQLSAAMMASSNPLGAAPPEPIQTVAKPTGIASVLTVDAISVNHIVLSQESSTEVPPPVPVVPVPPAEIEYPRTALAEAQARIDNLENGIKAFEKNSEVAKNAREILIGLVK